MGGRFPLESVAALVRNTHRDADVKGETLGSRLPRKPLELPEALDIAV
jgi:hypothetical protein